MTTNGPSNGGPKVTFKGFGLEGSVSGRDVMLIVVLAAALGIGLWLHERRLDGLATMAGKDHAHILQELENIRERLNGYGGSGADRHPSAPSRTP